MSEITIYTLAKELNMTPSMVSRAFNPNARVSDEKRKIVLDTAKKYDFSPNRFASRLSMKVVRIGVLINNKFQVNTDKMILGLKSAHEELKDYKIQYDVTVLDPSKYSSEGMRQNLKLYKEYDGIIISGMSSAKYTDFINELYGVTSNVVQVQAVNQNARCLFASKHNEETAANLAAEFLCNCLKKAVRRNILLFTGDLNSTLHQNAMAAFKNSCAAKGLDLLSVVDMKDNEEYFEKILPTVFEQYGDQVDGIYITSGLSLPLCRYLEQNNIDLSFIAFDIYEDIKRYLEKGIVTATVSQNVTVQMKTAFKLLVKHIIIGEKCPDVVHTDVQLVMKSNMYQFN